MFTVTYLLRDRGNSSAYHLTTRARGKEFFNFLLTNYNPKFVTMTDKTGTEIACWRETQ